MNLLAIETSTDQATVALAIHGEIYSEEQGTLRQQAEWLLPMIECLLCDAGVSFKALDAIVFGRGPGSFTGLRMACSVAKALAYAHDLPVYPVSSLASIAHEAYQTEKDLKSNTQVLAMMDARMKQVYWGCFSRGCFEVFEQVSCAADVVLTTSSPILLAGVDFEAYAAQLPPALQAQVIKQRVIFPHARTMIHLVQSGHCKSVTANEALPTYVRDQITQGDSSG